MKNLKKKMKIKLLLSLLYPVMATALILFDFHPYFKEIWLNAGYLNNYTQQVLNGGEIFLLLTMFAAVYYLLFDFFYLSVRFFFKVYPATNFKQTEAEDDEKKGADYFMAALLLLLFIIFFSKLLAVWQTIIISLVWSVFNIWLVKATDISSHFFKKKVVIDEKIALPWKKFKSNKNYLVELYFYVPKEANSKEFVEEIIKAYVAREKELCDRINEYSKLCVQFGQ